MYSSSVVIKNKTGLHMRPAAEFLRCAAGFQSQVTLIRSDDGRRGNAKSALSLLKMELVQGTEIRLEAEGPDEQKAVETLIGLINSGFDE